MLIVSPDVKALDGSESGMVRSFALLKPLLPPSAPRSVPELTGVPFCLTIRLQVEPGADVVAVLQPEPEPGRCRGRTGLVHGFEIGEAVAGPSHAGVALWSPTAKTWSVMSCV